MGVAASGADSGEACAEARQPVETDGAKTSLTRGIPQHKGSRLKASEKNRHSESVHSIALQKPKATAVEGTQESFSAPWRQCNQYLDLIVAVIGWRQFGYNQLAGYLAGRLWYGHTCPSDCGDACSARPRQPALLNVLLAAVACPTCML